MPAIGREALQAEPGSIAIPAPRCEARQRESLLQRHVPMPCISLISSSSYRDYSPARCTKNPASCSPRNATPSMIHSALADALERCWSCRFTSETSVTQATTTSTNATISCDAALANGNCCSVAPQRNALSTTDRARMLLQVPAGLRCQKLSAQAAQARSGIQTSSCHATADTQHLPVGGKGDIHRLLLGKLHQSATLDHMATSPPTLITTSDHRDGHHMDFTFSRACTASDYMPRSRVNRHRFGFATHLTDPPSSVVSQAAGPHSCDGHAPAISLNQHRASRIAHREGAEAENEALVSICHSVRCRKVDSTAWIAC